jgi:hypothetical protein
MLIPRLFSFFPFFDIAAYKARYYLLRCELLVHTFFCLCRKYELGISLTCSYRLSILLVKERENLRERYFNGTQDSDL